MRRLVSAVLAFAAVAPIGAAQEGLPFEARVRGAQEGRTTASKPLSEEEKILLVLSRFTPGATPELVDEVRKTGWSAWFDGQLKADLKESESYNQRILEFETIGLPMKDLFEKYTERVGKDATEAEKREARRRAAIPPRETLAWIMTRAVYSNNVLLESSCDFFRNHLSVSIDKGEVRFLIVDWERQVIFRRALTNFGDILAASAKHPAMLFYLDNFLSRRPPTPEELKAIETRTRKRTGSEERADEAVDIARQRGLNENYARELLELHTLGVDNGYTQQDVIELAKCLTGWTIRCRVEPAFVFDRSMHCGGDKTVLGQVIKAGGVEEGEEVMRRLVAGERTAKFIAWKLCRWFVNDSPDEAMVQRVAKVFSGTNGDLPKVYRAIVDDPLFFTRENFQAKFKRPWEFVISALRVTHADASRLAGLENALQSMNEPLYKCADPTGYYDQAEAWRDPGAMATRWSFATDLVSGRIGGVRVPSSLYDGLPLDKPREWKAILVKKILPIGGISEATSASIDRLVAAELQKNPKATPAKLGASIVAMLLGSPEFQRQ